MPTSPTASAPPPAAYTLPAGGLASLTEGDADGVEKVGEYRRMLAEMQQGAAQPGEGR